MWTVGFLTLALPWLIWPGIEEPFLAPKLLAWLAGSWALILSVAFGRARLIACPLRPVAWFGGWVVALGLLGFYVPYLLRPIGKAVTLSGDRWFGAFYILTALLTWQALQAYVVVRPYVFQITRWCCWTAFALAIYQGLQTLGWDQFYTQDLKRATHETLYVFRPYAGLGNIQFVAMTQALTLPLFLLFRGWRYVAMGMVVLGAVTLSHVRFAQATAILTLLAYGISRLWHGRRRWRLAILAGLLVFGALGSAWAWRVVRTDERRIIWSEVIYQWQQPNAQGRPLAMTGRGIQSFRERFWLTTRGLRPETVAALGIRYDNAHSDALQCLYELGLVGLALAAWLGGALLVRGWAQATTPVSAGWWASLVGLLAVSVVYFPWHLAHSAWLGSLIIAMNLRQPEGAGG